MENYHDRIVAYFIKLEFITKLAWALYALTFNKSLDEDAFGSNVGNCARLDTRHFLGYGLSLVEVHVR
jgi:hypothetical protein